MEGEEELHSILLQACIQFISNERRTLLQFVRRMGSLGLWHIQRLLLVDQLVYNIGHATETATHIEQRCPEAFQLPR